MGIRLCLDDLKASFKRSRGLLEEATEGRREQLVEVCEARQGLGELGAVTL